MSPNKKAKTSPAAMPEDPVEYASHMRAQMMGDLMNSTTAEMKERMSYDVEQNIREIRAILTINDEIFGRCMDSMDLCHSFNDKSGRNVSAVFHRQSCDVVKVSPVNSSTRFTTPIVCSEKTFNLESLVKLPDCLAETFVVKYKEKCHSNFIDYDAFFHRSLSLHEEVLGPFLAKLKDHLETIQVCLGNIDIWMLEPMGNAKFLKKMFGYKIPISKGPLKQEPSSSSSESEDSSSDSEDDEDEECNYYILKECDDSGEYRRTFNLSEKDERKKLKIFLQFMTN